MSTQDVNGVPILILPEADLQRFRLIELPPELLALVTSDHPPRLELKSKEDPDGASKDTNVVLCTPDTTYAIRQVSTSNSVFLTQPQEEVDASGGLPMLAVEAVAKCDSTLELLATPRQSALPYIRTALPIYSSTGSYGASTVASKAELFSHIPLSQAECEQAWSELACFESVDPAGCYLPHATVRAQIWATALTAAVADGANLTDPFIAGEIPAFALDFREDWPSELLPALFASVSVATQGGNLAINGEKCVRVVGRNLLEAMSGGKAIDKDGFMKRWKDAVPEAWREKCDTVLLRDIQLLQETPGSITFTEATIASNGMMDSAGSSKAALGAKRKWHEKFRSQKKTS